MKVGLDAGGVTTGQTFVVPKVNGDAAAARRLATSYRQAADDVEAATRQASLVVDELIASWHGVGSSASQHPLTTVHRDAAVTVRALRDSADALEAYAHKLETAHHHHWFSLHKLLAVAAVVTVTATAIVVTMGAAAAAEAALAAGAASEATAAAGAAAAAGSGAASALGDSTLGLAGVRALLSFAVPHLVQAELAGGFAAGLEEAGGGRLDWHEIAVSFGAGFAGSAGAASTGRVAQAMKLAERASPWVRLLLPHLGQAAGWTGVDAGVQETDGGHLSMRDLLLTAGLSGVGSAAAVARAAGPLHLAAYNARQSLDDLLTGRLDLDLHEGPHLGHTLAKHVEVTDADLWQRITTEGRPQASRFFDRATADRAIAAALARNRGYVTAALADGAPEVRVRLTFENAIGVVMKRSGALEEATQVVVRVARDDFGFYIYTAYPELQRK
jgi:uncharacterized protein YukE